MISLVVVVRRI